MLKNPEVSFAETTISFVMFEIILHLYGDVPYHADDGTGVVVVVVNVVVTGVVVVVVVNSSSTPSLVKLFIPS